jgi:hypothetical protein
MAGIIHIAPAADPPEGADWVLIKREASEAFSGSGSVSHSHGRTFYAPPPEDISVAIDAACAWADAHSVAVVYLRSLPNAPRPKGEKRPPT